MNPNAMFETLSVLTTYGLRRLIDNIEPKDGVSYSDFFRQTAWCLFRERLDEHPEYIRVNRNVRKRFRGGNYPNMVYGAWFDPLMIKEWE